MTLQTLKIGGREFVFVSKRDFAKLAAQAARQTEDDYWTLAALHAEAAARGRKNQLRLRWWSASWMRGRADGGRINDVLPLTPALSHKGRGSKTLPAVTYSRNQSPFPFASGGQDDYR